MRYFKSDCLDKMDDNELVYVNRNALNLAITEYEINIDESQYTDELRILLQVWNKIHEQEMRTNRIEHYIKMTSREIKKCFKNYKDLPIGSFCKRYE